jgi:glutamate carboxypeptidase
MTPSATPHIPAPHPEVRRCIAEIREPALHLLGELVACDSYCHNKAGVDRVGDLVTAAMPACFEHQLIPEAVCGDHHIYRHSVPGRLPILLAGHLDTIGARDEGFDCMESRETTLVGPGVADMKGGDVVAIFALRVLERCGLLDDIPVVCIFNGDEELGSPRSHPLFCDMRDKVSAALVFESGGPEGTVVIARKGIQRYRMHITGKGCHFGNLHEAKVSAVLELAHKVLAIEALNREDGSLVTNVGRVEGGLLANCVAGEASLDYELRYWDAALAEEVEGHVQALLASTVVPGCELRNERLSHRPPMQVAPDLYARVRVVAESLGLPAGEEKRGGVSDACWLSHVGIPVVDGLGPLGDCDNTCDEYIVTESLFQRIELTANLLLTLNSDPLTATAGEA